MYTADLAEQAGAPSVSPIPMRSAQARVYLMRDGFVAGRVTAINGDAQLI